MKFYADFWTRCLDFEGRTSRKDFWLTVLFNVIISFGLQFIASLDKSSPARILYLVFGVAGLIPGIAMCIRRLHDMGKSGASILLGLIPFFGTILLLVYYCSPSVGEASEQGQVPQVAGTNTIYADILTVIGISKIVIDTIFIRHYFLSYNYYRYLSNFNNIYQKYYLYLLLPVIGCIFSILYFMKNNAIKKRIQWEYLGIVISFESLLFIAIRQLDILFYKLGNIF